MNSYELEPHIYEPEEMADSSAIREDTSLGWITSYSDLVTLLLCFFILFFSIYAKKKIEKVKENAATAERKKMNERLRPKTLGLSLDKIDEAFANLEGVYSVIEQTPGLDTFSEKGYFQILFKDGNFFEQGSHELNLNGQYRVSMVLERLLPHADKILVAIQGHSDSTPLTKSKNKYESNINLSMKRALSVYKHFIKFGYPEEGLSISGFSHHRPIKVSKKGEEEEEVQARSRRVTFRVESR